MTISNHRVPTSENSTAFRDRTGFSVREKNAYYRDLLARLLKSLIPPGSRVLDLGCGNGDALNALNASYGVGVDISSAMVKLAREKYPHLQFHAADIEALSLDAGPFDKIMLSNVIGSLNDVQQALRSMKRFTRPGTKIVITHYNYLWEPVLKLAEMFHLKAKEPYQNWLSLNDLVNLLALEGYEVVKTRQSILLPVRVPVLSWFCNRILANLPLLWRLALQEVVVARPSPSLGKTDGLSCSVVVPARNERGTIEEIVKRVPDMGRHTQIIFVEGHSTDGTREEIERVRLLFSGRDIKALQQDGEGKADAVRKGLAHASGDILMVLDADLTVRPEELPKFFEAAASGVAELAIGNRLVYQPERESMRYLNLLGNKFFSMAFSFLLDQRIKDTLCGVKAISRVNYLRVAADRSFLGDLDPFGDFDLLFGAARANLKIREIPVRYYARTYGSTQIRRFRHGILLLRMVCRAARKLKFIG